MTIPVERTRALLWAGGFLIQLARDKRLPVDVRRSAVIIARHFPTIEDVAHMAMFRQNLPGSGLDWRVHKRPPRGPRIASSGHCAIRPDSNCPNEPRPTAQAIGVVLC